ncbi:alpha-amylase family glycosyl hydrolase [Rudanella lutea]|uniref:alpha-amylase family glycosyl hydrolase n=1 Tax=Rudanella lutea TaxID=451374 RepID=UPI0003A39385|nr:alpha-amylase family glycosyl hydrolase [Rudanella lutea]
MRNHLLSLCCLLAFALQAVAQSTPQIMFQGWYWDYPKTGQSTTGPSGVSFNWSDTLRLKAPALSQAGFTHVWYPPFAGNGNRSGGYDPRDLFVGPSQTSLGTLPEIKSMVNSLTAVGITPVADMVYNHRDAGDLETNPAVKDYITTFASGNNPSCGFKRPFPSDRYRMVIPIGGSAAEGAGTYYIKMRSRGNIFNGAKYAFHATTNKIGGSRWSPVVTPDVDLTTSADVFQYSAQLGRNYLNRIDGNGDLDEFAVTVTTNDFNAAGDLLIIQAINYDSEYSDHLPIDIFYVPANGGGAYNVADFTNPFGAGYKLQFQTYTNFGNMPSGRGALDWNGFRPHFTSSSPAGWSQTTCLGPQWSMQSLDYFYDYDHNIPATKDLLVDWTKWAFDDLGSKGLRVDAVKHFEPSFMRTMLEEMRASGRTPNLVVGEWYGNNRAELKGWVDAVYSGMNTDTRNNVQVRVFDFALRDALKQALDNGADPRNAYFNSLRFATDGNSFGSGNNIVTFLNNHDFRSDNPTFGDALVHNNPDLGYAWILTNNQLGVPAVFYPDYYGYPARNTTYGNDVIGFNYHPVGLPALKPAIDKLIQVHKKYITGSTSMDLLNHFGGSNTAPAPNNYIQSSPNKVLIYQLNASGSVGGKEVLVAINFDNQPLRVDHQIAVRNGIQTGTRFGDVLGRSAFPFAVVDGQNRVYMELPAKSYSVWVQDAAPLSVTLASTTVCAGESNTLTAAVSGGTAPYQYQFSAGTVAVPGSSSIATASTAGVYSVTVTDALGLSATATVSATVLQPAFAAAPTLSQTLVSGGQSLTLSYMANNAPGSCAFAANGPFWAEIASNSSFPTSTTLTPVTADATQMVVALPASLNAGELYYLRVGYGQAVYSPAASLVVSTTLTIVANQTVVCPGGQVQLDASGCPAPNVVVWSTGQSGPSIIVNPATTTTISASCVSATNARMASPNTANGSLPTGNQGAAEQAFPKKPTASPNNRQSQPK